MKQSYIASVTDTVDPIVPLSCFLKTDYCIPHRQEWPGVVDLSDLLTMTTKFVSDF